MWLHYYHSSSSLCARKHFSIYYIYSVAYNLAITHATATCCEVFSNSKVFAHLLVEFWCLFVLRLSDRLRQCSKLHYFNCLLASQHRMKPKKFYTSLESGTPSLKISSITANICIQVSFGPESIVLIRSLKPDKWAGKTLNFDVSSNIFFQPCSHVDGNNISAMLLLSYRYVALIWHYNSGSKAMFI